MTGDGRIDVTFAGSTVRFEYRGPRSARIVRFLWRDVRRLRPRIPVATCRLEDGDGGGILRLRVVDRRAYEGPSEEMAVACLLDEAMFHLADRGREGLILHAGCVAGAEGAVLLPGGSGTGKTTLTSWLVSQGWRYLTDELVFIPTRSSVAEGLARPLNVKDTAVLRRFIDRDFLRGDTMVTPQGILLRASALGASRPAGRTPIARLVFPHYTPHTAYALTPLSPAKAGVRLMGCLVNARNLDGHGFPEVTRLAKHVPAFELRYGTLAQLDDWRR